MSDNTKLSKASTYFFFSGFFISKIRYLPFIILSPLLNLVSLFLYLIGYSLWFIASHFYPSQGKIEKEWYGFAQFKEQHLYAAALGLAATVISIIAIFSPILLLPAGWIFAGGNILWTISEYHKLNNPPVDEKDYVHERQSKYVSYALTISLISIVTSASTTLTFLFPVITLPILVATSFLCIGLGAWAVEYWLESNFGDSQACIVMDESYKQMNNQLGKTNNCDSASAVTLCHGSNLPSSKAANTPLFNLAAVEEEQGERRLGTIEYTTPHDNSSSTVSTKQFPTKAESGKRPNEKESPPDLLMDSSIHTCAKPR
ncbi:hypothetical protein EP47_11755 [Legionella norrlandica]|uniref:Uncharacterized protein n=1 Tax=Legionella norrlandica TaxID=1498499 RepID=A0A0A2SYF5_9GAMM|nr:hypothetical protein [Legionella norrlandica]KGP64434.1 hypothetical protein EP47_11755 [Legionella norrlandica]